MDCVPWDKGKIFVEPFKMWCAAQEEAGRLYSHEESLKDRWSRDGL